MSRDMALASNQITLDRPPSHRFEQPLPEEDKEDLGPEHLEWWITHGDTHDPEYDSARFRRFVDPYVDKEHSNSQKLRYRQLINAYLARAFLRLGDSDPIGDIEGPTSGVDAGMRRADPDIRRQADFDPTIDPNAGAGPVGVPPSPSSVNQAGPAFYGQPGHPFDNDPWVTTPSEVGGMTDMSPGEPTSGQVTPTPGRLPGSLSPGSSVPKGPSSGYWLPTQIPKGKIGRRIRQAAREFLDDNLDCVDYAPELRFRAERHARNMTSALTPDQSRVITAALVDAVEELSSAVPPLRTAAKQSTSVPDFADELLYDD